MEVFGDYAYYYNAFYRDKNYQKEAEQVVKLLNQYGGGETRNIINYGCGTGRHDIELGKMGYQCTGIDMSRLMIDIARKNAEKESVDINFFVSDIRSYEPTEKYDAVISLFHVMSYQNRNEDILSAFQTARKALTEKKIFLFDVWYGPGVLTDKPGVRVKEIEDDYNKLIRIARPIMNEKNNIVEVHYEVFIIDKKTGETQTINEIHSMRYFFRPELEFLLQQAGFELIDNIDCNILGRTSFHSWTSYFIARTI